MRECPPVQRRCPEKTIFHNRISPVIRVALVTLAILTSGCENKFEPKEGEINITPVPGLILQLRNKRWIEVECSRDGYIRNRDCVDGEWTPVGESAPTELNGKNKPVPGGQ